MWRKHLGNIINAESMYFFDIFMFENLEFQINIIWKMEVVALFIT
jgi:hypothetical protein